MYTITYHGNHVYLKTPRRHIMFKSFESIYEAATMVLDNMEWRIQCFPAMSKEQEEDGLIDAFRYIKYGRKKNALVHLRMVAKLLYWHKLSVEKLWDPSKPENRERIMAEFYSDI